MRSEVVYLRAVLFSSPGSFTVAGRGVTTAEPLDKENNICIDTLDERNASASAEITIMNMADFRMAARK